MLGAARLLMAVEEHGSGRQLVRFRVWVRSSATGILLVLLFSTLAVAAEIDHAWVASSLFGLTAILVAVWMLQQCAAAMATLLRPLEMEKGAASHAIAHTLEQRSIEEI